MLTLDGLSQPVHELTDLVNDQVQSIEALADRGYNFEQILRDSTLKFTTVRSVLSPARVYWLRLSVINASSMGRTYNVRALPNLLNTYYYFDHTANKWNARQAGLLKPHRQRQGGWVPFYFPGNTSSIIYIKTHLAALGEIKESFNVKVIFNRADLATQRERDTVTVWIAGLTVLLLFFLNNLYVYFNFRDKFVAYYLLAQLAGMVYLTSYWLLFRTLIPCPVFSFAIHGDIESYELNHLLMHVSIVLILFSFVQLTLSYLNASKTLPRLHVMLRRMLFSYIVFSLFVATVNVSGFYLEHYTLIFDNLFCLMIVAMIAFTSIIGHLRKLPAATTLLAANIFPLVFMMGIPAYHVFISDNGFENLWIPVLIIATHALGFSITIVDRTRTMQAELNAKDIASRQLEFGLREVEMKHQLMELQNQKITASHEFQTSLNDMLQQQLSAQRRELVSSTLYMVQKNELLGNLKMEIDGLSNPGFYTSKHKDLESVRMLLQNNLRLDADWNKFKTHFELVHPRFFEMLKENHPTLTVKETQLYAYFHMNLSHKEIAALLNIDPASVRRAKTRLYKKLAIQENGDGETAI